MLTIGKLATLNQLTLSSLMITDITTRHKRIFLKTQLLLSHLTCSYQQTMDDPNSFSPLMITLKPRGQRVTFSQPRIANIANSEPIDEYRISWYNIKKYP